MSAAPLVPPAQVAALSQRSDAAGLKHLAGHLLALVGTGSLLALSLGTWWQVPATVAHGIVQVALFAGLHESVHLTAFRSRRLCQAVAAAIGLVHFLPAQYFRRFHLAHHRFTQDPGRDPELLGPKPASPAQYLLLASGLYYWRDKLGEIVRLSFERADRRFIPRVGRRRIVREARIHLAVYLATLTAILAGFTAPLYFWWLPALAGQPFLRLYLLAEHTGCPETPDMVRNTRTTFTNPIVRFLMWNMPYHVEHHVYPGVPFHRLADLSRLIADRLVVTAPGYAAFNRRYWRILRGGEGPDYARGRLSLQDQRS